MRLNRIVIAIAFILLSSSQAISERCPGITDEKTAVHFLIDHKANSTAADPNCVDEAFNTLTLATRFRNKSYIRFLLGMLDFERWTPEGYMEAGEPKFPAMNDVYHLHSVGKNVVPYLVKAIKESDSEVLRTNAAELLWEFDSCVALRILTREAENSEIAFEQRERLYAAVDYVNDRIFPTTPCEHSSSP